MAAEKSPKAKSHSQTKLAQGLAAQERRVGKTEMKQADRRRLKLFPKSVIILAWLIILVIAGTAVVLQTQQQNLINENKQQFIAIRDVLNDIKDADEFSAPHVRWVRDEQCEYSPGRFELTYEARMGWRCRVAIERETRDYENIEDLQKQLVDAIDDQTGGERSTETTLLTLGNISCYARSITLGGHDRENGKLSGVRLNCSGNAFKSWYPNNEQRSAIEGKDAWRALE